MKKIFSFFFSLLTLCALIIPGFACDGPTDEVVFESVEACNEIHPRDAVLFYRRDLISNDGRIKVTIELGVDTRNNEIIDVHRILGIDRVGFDYYTTTPVSPELVNETFSQDKTTVEFRIQFKAKTKDDPILDTRYANFKTSI